MNENHLPTLYAIQYSEFDINRGASIYYEVRAPKFNSITSGFLYFRRRKQFLVKINALIGSEILFVLNLICKTNWSCCAFDSIFNDSLISVRFIFRTIENQKLIGCPMIIADEEKYKNNRNEWRFNACFIVPAQADAMKYEVAVRKLAKYLRNLEVSRSMKIFLFDFAVIFFSLKDRFLFFDVWKFETKTFETDVRRNCSTNKWEWRTMFGENL